MNDRLDQIRIERLAHQLMLLARDHLRAGPTHRDRVYEVLSALAMVTGVMLAGTQSTGTEDTAELFFELAMRQQLAASRVQ
jgi:hypothetical protein